MPSQIAPGLRFRCRARANVINQLFQDEVNRREYRKREHETCQTSDQSTAGVIPDR